MKTYHDGAAEERRSWLRKLRSSPRHTYVDELIDWGRERVKRYRQRKGGLGRKVK